MLFFPWMTVRHWSSKSFISFSWAPQNAVIDHQNRCRHHGFHHFHPVRLANRMEHLVNWINHQCVVVEQLRMVVLVASSLILAVASVCCSNSIISENKAEEKRLMSSGCHWKIPRSMILFCFVLILVNLFYNLLTILLCCKTQTKTKEKTILPDQRVDRQR